MKFGKGFESQMLPEWQDAYMDHNFLKLILKDILRHQQLYSRPSPRAPTGHLAGPFTEKGVTLPSLQRPNSQYAQNFPKKTSEDEEVIIVSAVQEEGSDHGRYQTMFLRSSVVGGECELLFFRRLDNEFTKFTGCYKEKVEEVAAKADELSKQMNASFTLCIRLEKPVMGLSGLTLGSLPSVSRHPQPLFLLTVQGQVRWCAH